MLSIIIICIYDTNNMLNDVSQTLEDLFRKTITVYVYLNFKDK